MTISYIHPYPYFTNYPNKVIFGKFFLIQDPIQSHVNAFRALYLVSIIIKQYQKLSLTFTTSKFVKSVG